MSYAAAMGYVLFLIVGLASVGLLALMRRQRMAIMTGALAHPALAGRRAAGRDELGERIAASASAAMLELGLVYAALAVVLVQTLYPLFWVLFGSLKTKEEIITNVWGRPPASSSPTMPRPGAWPAWARAS